jgi:hypothetical protein
VSKNALRTCRRPGRSNNSQYAWPTSASAGMARNISNTGLTLVAVASDRAVEDTARVGGELGQSGKRQDTASASAVRSVATTGSETHDPCVIHA